MNKKLPQILLHEGKCSNVNLIVRKVFFFEQQRLILDFMKEKVIFIKNKGKKTRNTAWGKLNEIYVNSFSCLLCISYKKNGNYI